MSYMRQNTEEDVSHYCVKCGVWKTDKNKYKSLSCLLAPSNHLPGSLGKFNVAEYGVDSDEFWCSKNQKCIRGNLVFEIYC